MTTTTTTTAPQIVGRIAGQPVYLDRFEDGSMCALSVTWQGLEVRTDGAEFIGVPMGGDFVGECSPSEWDRLAELARSGVVEQLLALARQQPR